MSTKQVAIISLVLFGVNAYAAVSVQAPIRCTGRVGLSTTMPANRLVWVKISEHRTGRHDDPIIWQGRVPALRDLEFYINLPMSQYPVRMSFFVNPPYQPGTNQMMLTQATFIGRVFLTREDICRTASLRLDFVDTGVQREKLNYIAILRFNDGIDEEVDLQR
jgi:hypothetical protein